MSFGDDVQRASKPYKPGKPLPPGTIVTGANRIGLFGPIGHKGHLFETGKAFKAEYSNSGYYQPARCIVCDEQIGPCDSEFWEVRATKEDVDRCLRMITVKRNQLLRARQELAHWGSKSKSPASSVRSAKGSSAMSRSNKRKTAT